MPLDVLKGKGGEVDHSLIKRKKQGKDIFVGILPKNISKLQWNLRCEGEPCQILCYI